MKVRKELEMRTQEYERFCKEFDEFFKVEKITDISPANIIAHEHCYINYDEHVNVIRYNARISAETYRMAEAYSYALKKLNLTIDDLDRYFVGYQYVRNEAEQAYDRWRDEAIEYLVNKFLKASK